MVFESATVSLSIYYRQAVSVLGLPKCIPASKFDLPVVL